MRITALIMAGGKGKRLGLEVEKPLLSFLDKPLIEWVIHAVESSRQLSQFYVVTSPDTLYTERLCSKKDLNTIKTDGKGYHHDLKQAILKGKLYHPVLTLSSDLPALTGNFLDEIIERYKKSTEPALTILVPPKRFEKLGLKTPSVRKYKGDTYVISGINIIDGKRFFEKQPEKVLIWEGIEAVLNINTLDDLNTAEKIMAKNLSNN